jgi:hypothetical protein
MPHYVGLDVSQKTAAICVVDEQGRRREPRSLQDQWRTRLATADSICLGALGLGAAVIDVLNGDLQRRVEQPRLRHRFCDGVTGRDRGWRLITARRHT